ncbi:MAG: MaoC/PaaZ C-terminal domain-containing protein [Polyangiales bacterium]
MHVSSRHVLQQGPMLATLGKTAARAFAQRVLPPSQGSNKLVTPGPELTRTFAPLSSELLDAFVAHLGGDPRAYRGVVPPHFFPHWAMPVAAETLRDLPYPILRVLNAGCRMQINAWLPRNEPLVVRAQLANIDDDGKRALITQRVITGTASVPDALHCEIYAFVPLPGGGKKNGATAKDKEKPRVPQGAREIAFGTLDADAGLSFAKLTGDFNPIHWVPAYAKASGFRNVILHGFGTFARAWESLARGLLGGDVRKVKLLEAKFTRPLVLPHAVGVYVKQREVYVGDGIEGPAYMTGRFDTGED